MEVMCANPPCYNINLVYQMVHACGAGIVPWCNCIVLIDRGWVTMASSLFVTTGLVIKFLDSRAMECLGKSPLHRLEHVKYKLRRTRTTARVHYSALSGCASDHVNRAIIGSPR